MKANSLAFVSGVSSQAVCKTSQGLLCFLPAGDQDPLWLSRRPRYRAAGPEITVTGGLGDERKQHVHAESFGMIADGPTEIRKAVRLCCREGVDNVKINISGDEFVSTARRSPR